MSLTPREWGHREYLRGRIRDCEREIEERKQEIARLTAKESPEEPKREAAKPKAAAKKPAAKRAATKPSETAKDEG